jgi:hypothetical protein
MAVTAIDRELRMCSPQSMPLMALYDSAHRETSFGSVRSTAVAKTAWDILSNATAYSVVIS